MTDFYPDRDRWLWPITITANNDEVRVIEDPNGTPTTITATLTHSDQLANSATYFAFGYTPTVDGSTTETKIVDGSGETLYAQPLYEEIVSQLRSESASSGNSLNYQIEAIQPSGSDYSNTGLRLTHDGALDIQLDFAGATNPLDPRFFGWSENGVDNGGTPPAAGGDTIDGPFSRWGVWFSPVSANDKRPRHERRTFQSAPHPRYHKKWRWTREALVRTVDYIAVPGVHVWPDDRASRSAEANRGGLPDGDRNNAMKYLFDKSGFDDDYVIVGHGDGEAALGSTVQASDVTTDTFETARLSREFLSTFEPQDGTDREHDGERYDVSIEYGANLPDDASTSAYRH